MHLLLYWLVRTAVAMIRVWPLAWLARAGRFGGSVVYHLDRRHRRVACQNLSMCFPDKPAHEIEALAQENFKRIGENFTCAIKTAFMSFEEIQQHVSFNVPRVTGGELPSRIVVAIGHFGNFELYARFGQFTEGYECATTYRGLRQPYLNQVLQLLRGRANCKFFERRSEAAALKAHMHLPNALIGLLCDQHAGTNGIPLPFLGHECSTSAAPALFALRYDCALLTGFCYRTGLARWQIEAGPEIQTHEGGRARPIRDIMSDVNRAFEAAVLRDPANWFWVHNRWKLKWRKPGKNTRRPAGRASEGIVERSAESG